MEFSNLLTRSDVDRKNRFFSHRVWNLMVVSGFYKMSNTNGFIWLCANMTLEGGERK